MHRLDCFTSESRRCFPSPSIFEFPQVAILVSPFYIDIWFHGSKRFPAAPITVQYHSQSQYEVRFSLLGDPYKRITFLYNINNSCATFQRQRLPSIIYHLLCGFPSAWPSQSKELNNLHLYKGIHKPYYVSSSCLIELF